jgi:hypothetical protein
VYPTADGAYGYKSDCSPIGCNFGCTSLAVRGAVGGPLGWQNTAPPCSSPPSTCDPHRTPHPNLTPPPKDAKPPLALKPQPGQRYIMLLDRGPRDAGALPEPCYFLRKAINAQAAGADAVLVVNDGPGDLSTAVAPTDEGSGCAAGPWSGRPAARREGGGGER